MANRGFVKRGEKRRIFGLVKHGNLFWEENISFHFLILMTLTSSKRRHGTVPPLKYATGICNPEIESSMLPNRILVLP